MKLAIIGASGSVGSRILAEALRRGHSVTGIARNPKKIPACPGVTPVRGDTSAPQALAQLLTGHDAVVSATRFVGSDAGRLAGAVRAAGVPRLLVVGGAGSREVTPELPAADKAEASAGRDFLDALRQEAEPAWTFMSPSALLVPGEHTGRFGRGADPLPTAGDGKSWISIEVYAIAALNELETPRHIRRRFTVGY